MGSFTFADKILDTIDDVRRGINGWLKADHTQYFPIATAHNKNVLALNNGSLLSVIRIHGYMGSTLGISFMNFATSGLGLHKQMRMTSRRVASISSGRMNTTLKVWRITP